MRSYVATLLAFCMYEFGLGMYWPAVAILRADLIPDNIRCASSCGGFSRTPSRCLSCNPSCSSSQDKWLRFILGWAHPLHCALLLLCVSVYNPCDRLHTRRSSVASLFRVPLNILVVMCLFLIGKTPESVVLCCCCAQVSLLLLWAAWPTFGSVM